MAQEQDYKSSLSECFSVTYERKYRSNVVTFIKRSLRPAEFKPGYRRLHIPRLDKERLMNEAACLRYIRKTTNIPVPGVYCDFEDDGAHYLVTEYIDGINMADLEDEQKKVVEDEIKLHLATLRGLTSSRPGGPSGLVIPPYRVTLATNRDLWQLLESDTEEYVFCHNDLLQQNIIVDPTTLKIRAIIDWEYSGFFPQFFERSFYTRLGPSAAVGDEVDDTATLLDFLYSHQVNLV